MSGGVRTRRRSLAAALLVVLTVLGTVAALGPSASATTPAPSNQAGPPARGVVLAGVAGLSWSDVTAQDMPTLHALAGTQAAGSVAVRSVYTANCVADGWLSIGAGRRAALPRPSGTLRTCVPPPAPRVDADGTAHVNGWTNLVDQNEDFNYDATPGLLGQSLADQDVCATALGPGAALALADEQGAVARYRAELDDLTDDDLTECPVTVVDLGSLPFGEPGTDERRQAASTLDERLADLQDRLPEDTALLVAGVSDSGSSPYRVWNEPAPEVPLGLRVGLASGPQPDGQPWGPHWLTSSSTRWTGMVVLLDLSATLTTYAGLDVPPDFAGKPWTAGAAHPGTAAATVDQLNGSERAAQVFRQRSGLFFQLLGLVELLGFAAAALLLWRRPPRARRRRILEGAHVFALAAAALPVASYLANLTRWWRYEHASLVLWLSILVIVSVIAAVAAVGPWRRAAYGPTGIVAGLTVLVLGVDVVTGSNLQHLSLLGLTPLTAGRFYGFGNIPYAVFVAAGLVLAAAAAQWVWTRTHSRRRAGATVAAIAFVVVVLDGADFAGADFGGVIPAVVGFAWLFFAVAKIKVSVSRVLLVGVIAVVAVSALALLDWTRPVAARTHLGDFVQQVLDNEAGEVVWRKARASIGTFGRPYYGWLVPLAYVVIVAAVVNPVRLRVPGLLVAFEWWPLLRTLIWAGLVTGAFGFALNDSGVIVPAIMLTIGIPLVVAAVARAHRLALPPEGPEAAHVDDAPLAPASPTPPSQPAGRS